MLVVLFLCSSSSDAKLIGVQKIYKQQQTKLQILNIVVSEMITRHAKLLNSTRPSATSVGIADHRKEGVIVAVRTAVRTVGVLTAVSGNSFCSLYNLW